MAPTPWLSDHGAMVFFVDIMIHKVRAFFLTDLD